MKHILLAAALMLGTAAFAQGEKATSANGAKLSKKDAKAECLKDNKDLKGAKLSECIKAKTK